MTDATKHKADGKCKLYLSYLVAILVHSFSLLKARSIRFRSRSYSQEFPWFDLCGMTTSAPVP